jgi:tetratricopeptide (TPR) repeat protein/tRNA A-37 threonylcarbamoyl transferase component Bud32
VNETSGDEDAIGIGLTDPALLAETVGGDPRISGAAAGAPPKLDRGRAIGRYLIVGRLGAGGMGVVLRAFDPDLDRSVAIKVVSVRAGDGVSDTLQIRDRLMREAQAIARISHPNVIAVYDVGLCDAAGDPIDDAADAALVYVAMEFVDGNTLGAWCKAPGRTWVEIRDAYVAAGRGLAEAHAAGLIHRDFKPDNVMVGRDGRVRVLDFGLARALSHTPTVRHEDVADLRTGQSDSLDKSMTVAGAVMGTPAYMSPEQHIGAPTDDKSDQFSFCVALFEALYGQRPFEGETVAALSFNVLQGRVVRPEGMASAAPMFVQRALLRGLLVDTQARFESMEALLRALTVDPSRRRRRWWLAAGAVGVLTLGAGLGARVAAEDPVAPPPAPCTGAAAAIDPVWNDARRSTIGDAFEATGRAYARGTWSRAAEVIDARTTAWIAEHTAACRATRVTAEQSEAKMDQRVACLERQRRDLDALLTALSRADDDGVRRAIDAVHKLPTPDRCVTPHDPGAPPRDPQDATFAAAIDDALPPITAAMELGRTEEARAALAPWVAPTDALDHPPVTARVRQLQAMLSDEPKVTRRLLEEALWAAMAAGDDETAARVAGRLVEAVGYALADREGGERWLAFARAVLQRTGGDRRTEAQIDTAEGATLVAAGRYEDALAVHERSREYWAAQEGGADGLAHVLLDMSAAQVQLGRIDEAIASSSQALELRRQVYGEDHPQVAAALREVGNASAAAQDFDAALPKMQEALRIQRAASGGRSIDVAVLLDDIGRILRRRGDLDGAIRNHTDALEIWQEVLGDPHADLAVSLLNIGYTLVAAGRYEDALAQQRRALAMFEAALGAEHPYLVYASNSVGSSLVELSRFAEARPVLEHALTLTHLSVDPTLFAETKFTLSHALVDDPSATAADRARARALATEARESYRTQPERWRPQIGQIDEWLRKHA